MIVFSIFIDRYHHIHCAQINKCPQIVRHDRTLEQIVFPIPEMCELITHDTKIRVLNTAERDDQGSKVSDFFERTEDMFNEMKWQKKLRGSLRYSRVVDESATRKGSII